MTTDAITIIPRSIEETKSLSKELAQSSLLPAALRKKPEDILAVVLTGAELGLAPMQALRGIHIIEGKPTLSADTMGALVKRSSVCEFLRLVESSATVATYETKRVGETASTTLSFTFAQAEAARVTGKDNWRKYPDAMLRARCLAALCRAVYPDVCLGVYEPEELATERDVTPPGTVTQAAHVSSIAEQIQAQATADVVEGTVVPEKVVALRAKIAEAKTAADLAALIPDLQSLTREQATEIRPAYLARKAEVSA